MSAEDKPKGLISVFKDLARAAAAELPKQTAAEETMRKAQEFLDTQLKPMGREIKHEIEEKLLGRIKAELRKQFLYQWLAIIVGIGIALVIVWVR